MEYYIFLFHTPGIAVEHPEARFLIIGSGEDEENFDRYSRDSGDRGFGSFYRLSFRNSEYVSVGFS